MNYLDLFSGIGGFALGAYWAGFKADNHFYSEIDIYCVDLYKKRFPDSIYLGDIKKIDCTKLKKEYGDDWVITGGFPCQDISIAGKGAGLDGERSGLWFEMWRIIRELRPKFVIAENVSAITFRGLDKVISSIAEIGYSAEWQCIRASDVGAPHRRERIWVVAYAQGEQGRGIFKQEFFTNSRTGGKKLAYPMREGLEGQWEKPIGIKKEFNNIGDDSWWAVEPDVGRMAHGIPKRVDRLKGLGNSIVPQIAKMLFLQIKQNG